MSIGCLLFLTLIIAFFPVLLPIFRALARLLKMLVVHISQGDAAGSPYGGGLVPLIVHVLVVLDWIRDTFLRTCSKKDKSFCPLLAAGEFPLIHLFGKGRWPSGSHTIVWGFGILFALGIVVVRYRDTDHVEGPRAWLYAIWATGLTVLAIGLIAWALLRPTG